jgi:hypothetical protein
MIFSVSKESSFISVKLENQKDRGSHLYGYKPLVEQCDVSQLKDTNPDGGIKNSDLICSGEPVWGESISLHHLIRSSQKEKE